MKLLFSVSLLFLASHLAYAQSESTLGGELAMIGEFHANSVSVESGEVWLGLYQVGDGAVWCTSRPPAKESGYTSP